MIGKTTVVALCMIGLSAGLVLKPASGTVQPTDPNTFSLSKAIRDTDSIAVFPAPARTFPALLVKRSLTDTHSVPLHLRSLDMQVKVLGNLAVTTMDMIFYNDLDRQLDGEFCFPLGEGQRVSGFALETQGNMREGVVVEKAEGRQVFESVVRKGIDPGLLEWTQGNTFRARIFPIPSKGTKRIRISFDQELVSTSNSYVYFLPMQYKNKIDRFSLRAEVVKQTVKPENYGKGITTLEFEHIRDSWVAEKKISDFLASAPLAFDIPRVQSLDRIYTQVTSQGSDSSYFYAFIEPDKYMREKKLPARLCILWDVSGSGEMRDHVREKSILDGYLKKIKNVQVTLVPFSNEAEDAQRFAIAEGDCSALLKAIDSLHYDGGTQLGALNLKQYSCDEFLLFSDGISNFGKEELRLSDTPLSVVCAAQEADFSGLQYLARAGNGQFINALTATTEEAARLLSKQPYRFISASYDSTRISSLAPSLPSDFRRTFVLAGIMKGQENEISLHFGYGTEIMATEKVTLHTNPMDENNLIARAWAQKRISELDLRYTQNKTEITALGKKYGIVTQNTSLLVLDRFEDYVQYHILPPDEKMRKDYLARMAETEKDKRDRKQEHLEQVVKDFNIRLNWWNKNFNTDSLQKEREKKTAQLHEQYQIDGSRISREGVADSTRVVLNSSNMTAVSADYMSITPGVTNTNNGGTATYNWTASSLGSVSVSGVSAGTYAVNIPPSNIASRSHGKYESKGEITLNVWDPKAPYIEELKKITKEQAYAHYLLLRKQNKNTPSFFMDVADYFWKLNNPKTAVRILSNLAELKGEDQQALRVLAHRLEQKGELELAIATYRKVLAIRGEEPQSYRDLGLALAANKRDQEAVDMLCKVVNRSWDSRFPEIETLVAEEINDIASCSSAKLKLDSLDKRLLHAMPEDVRIVINWDSNDCDIDLWTTDPFKEKCMFNHPRTLAGGRISRDFTGGYGPEEFVVHKAIAGKYLIQVNYYGTRQQTLYGPATVQAELYTHYGMPDEVKKEITIRMKENKEVVDIGELVFRGSGQ
jgi:hypothetical protein